MGVPNIYTTVMSSAWTPKLNLDTTISSYRQRAKPLGVGYKDMYTVNSELVTDRLV